MPLTALEDKGWLAARFYGPEASFQQFNLLNVTVAAFLCVVDSLASCPDYRFQPLAFRLDRNARFIK